MESSGFKQPDLVKGIDVGLKQYQPVILSRVTSR